MASQYLRRFPVPEDFREILEAFTREILREQPSDVVAFGAHYFHCKETGQVFEWHDPHPKPKPADYPLEGQPRRDEVVIRPRSQDRLVRAQASRGTEDSRTPYSEHSRKQTSGEQQKPSEGSEQGFLYDKTVKNLSSYFCAMRCSNRCQSNSLELLCLTSANAEKPLTDVFSDFSALSKCSLE